MNGVDYTVQYRFSGNDALRFKSGAYKTSVLLGKIGLKLSEVEDLSTISVGMHNSEPMILVHFHTHTTSPPYIWDIINVVVGES